MSRLRALRVVAAVLTAASSACTAPRVPAPDEVVIEAEPIGGEPIFWAVREDAPSVPARVEPDAEAPILTHLPGDLQRVRSFGCTPAAPEAAPAWCRVETDAGLGWVSTRYLERPDA